MGEVSWSANRRGQYTRYKKKHMSKFASFAAVARQDCRRQNAMFAMNLYLILLSVTFSKQEQSIFQADASDKVKLGFVNQNQEHRADFSKMVVDWEPRAMVMDVTLLGDLDKQVVEVREEEVDEWQRVDNAPKQRAGMYRVRSTMAQPCRPHWVRILMPTTDGSLEVYEHPRPLPAATREQLTTYQRKFVPSQPENLHARAHSSSSASVSWHASPCAELYDVYVGDRKETTNDTRVLLDNLDPCLDYEVSVSAVLGDQKSEEAVSYLTTPPTEDVMTTVNIQVNEGASSVMALWTPPTSLMCVTSYSVTLCLHEAKCQDPMIQGADGQGGIVMFRARDLTPCSNYTLHIAPRFGEFSFEANSVKANTHLGDCKQDLQDQSLEEKVNSTTPQTLINLKQGHSKGASLSSKGSTPFLSNIVILLSVILFVRFGKYN